MDELALLIKERDELAGRLVALEARFKELNALGQRTVELGEHMRNELVALNLTIQILEDDARKQAAVPWTVLRGGG
jgi:hypothetical protein